MSEPGEFSVADLRSKHAQSRPASPPEQAASSAREFASERRLPPPPTATDDSEDEAGFELPVDRWRIVAAIMRRWYWILLAACVAAPLGFVASSLKVNYKLKMTLIMREASTAFAAGLVGESYRPQQLTMQTLVNMIKSPELIRRVAVKVQPPIPESTLKRSVEVVQELQTDLLTLTIAGKTPESLLDLANTYANEAVQMGKELQVAETSRMNNFYRQRISATEEELNQANDELIRFRKESQLVDPESETQTYMKQLGEILSKYDSARIDSELMDLQIVAFRSELDRQNQLVRQNPGAQRLDAAKIRLAELLTKYTEAHPAVQSLRQEIKALDEQFAAAQTNASSTGTFGDDSLAGTLYLRLVELQTRKATLQKELLELDKLKQSLQEKVTGISEKGLHYALLRAKLESLKNSRSMLVGRQREAQLYEDNALGYYRVYAPPRIEDIDVKSRWMGVIKFTAIGFVLGALALSALIAGVEILDDRLKTAVDVKRVTGLPLLATLGDLDTMSAEEKDAWAFRAWTALSGQLSVSANHGMVCGFISSMQGEGRSTWINLLIKAASQRGLHVLTVATRPSPMDSEPVEAGTSAPEQAENKAAKDVLARTEMGLPAQVTTLTPQIFESPAEATRQLTGPNAPPIAHISLPGWTWNLERRKQWQNALAHWRTLDNLVLLIELPPASMPEAVLLAERLPQLIWLVDSGKARARATREQLETLRHAKCLLVGCVLNHAPKPVFEL